MSAPVAIRCPNCGTTQATLGECDACHEATARYFCSNHSPGLWLDGPVCGACGARVGAGPPRRSAPPPPASPPPRRSERPPTSPPDLTPPSRTPPSRTPPPPPPPRRRSERVRDLPPRESRPPTPAELMRDLWTTYLPERGRGRPRDHDARDARDARDERAGRFEVPPAAPPAPPAPPIDFSVAVSAGRGIASAVGCVAKLVMLIVVAAILFALVTFSGFMGVGAPIREWGQDVGQRTGLVEGVPEQTRRAIATYEGGDAETAERELREAAQTYPRSALALLYLARIKTDGGDLERAGEYLREALVREPANALTHREMGTYHLLRARRFRRDPAREPYATDELLAAERYFSRALQLAPGDQRARGYLGCVFADLDRKEEAEVEIARAGPGEWQSCIR